MPDHAGMPVVAGEHEARGIVRVAGSRDGVQDLLENALVDRLPSPLQYLEFSGERFRLSHVVGQQQAEAIRAVADPTDGVEARRKDEPDLSRAQLFPASPARSSNARRPGQRVSASTRSPCLTSTRFSPSSGTTSATVASATKSSR